MEQRWDSDVKHFFVKIINSIAISLIWMITMATAGLYFKMAYQHGQPFIQVVLFYFFMAVTLFLVIRYLYRKWK